VTKVPSVTSIREKTGLSQPRFAELLGVSVRTLQEWEQGRRAPSGAARTLLRRHFGHASFRAGQEELAFTPNFGSISSAQDSRQLQFAARFVF